MSDEPIEIALEEGLTRQQAVDELVARITAGRGTPDRAVPEIAPPNMKVTINQQTGETVAEYADPISAARAVARATLPDDGDIPTNVSFDHQLAQLDAEIDREQKRLDAHLFDPITGNKLHRITGQEREALERRVAGLRETSVMQREIYDRAKAARAVKAENAARIEDANRLADSVINGDPERREAFRKALIEREMGHLADAYIRTRLGQLD